MLKVNSASKSVAKTIPVNKTKISFTVDIIAFILIKHKIIDFKLFCCFLMAPNILF